MPNNDIIPDFVVMSVTSCLRHDNVQVVARLTLPHTLYTTTFINFPMNLEVPTILIYTIVRWPPTRL